MIIFLHNTLHQWIVKPHWIKGQSIPIIHVKSMLNLIVRTHKYSRKSNFRWEGTKISPSLFLIFGLQSVPAKNAWRLPLLSFRDHLFCCLSFVSWRPMRMFNQRRFSHCSTNTSPISNKARASQWLPPCMPCRPPWKYFGERKSRNETSLF